MKAITVHYPYSNYIIDHHKEIETRHWKHSYRGLVAIHVGKTWNDELKAMTEHLAQRFPYELAPYAVKTPPLGTIIGICRLVHYHKSEDIRDELNDLERSLGDYSDGRFGWQMQVLEVFPEPIPAKGAQGLWDWSPPKGFFDNRVAIVGSRNFPDKVTVYEYVDKLPKDTIVISGGAKGVDQAAEYAARQCGLKVISIPVLDEEWRVVGNDAGHIRNQSIIDMAGRVVAFHFENSPGTADSIAKANAAGKPLLINPHLNHSSTGEKMTGSIRHSRDTVMPIAQEFAGMLKLACEQLQIAGSLRRNKPDVKDAELAAVPKIIDGQNALLWVLGRLLEEGTIEKALYGEKKTTRWGEKYRGFLYKGIKFEIFITQPASFGYQYWLRTGPGDANMYFMKHCKSHKAPFKVEDGRVWWNDTALDIPDEQAWFKLLGIPSVAPGQRSVETYTRLFEHEPHQWGDPKKFIRQAKQLTLGADFHIYDEGALIDYLVRKEKLKPHTAKRDEQPFEWSAPWLRKDGMVYVFNGWEDGQRKYAIAPVDSPRARVHARTISGCNYMSETEALVLWQVQQNKNTIPVSKPVYSGYVCPEAYEFADDAPIENVPLADMTYTMPDVFESWVWWYEREMSDVDSNGDLPLVARFACGKVLLLDGHHRAEAKQRLGREGMRAKVNYMPMTFEEAIRLSADDGSDDLALFADIIEEVYAILQEAQAAKELEYA